MSYQTRRNELDILVEIVECLYNAPKNQTVIFNEVHTNMKHGKRFLAMLVERRLAELTPTRNPNDFSKYVYKLTQKGLYFANALRVI